MIYQNEDFIYESETGGMIRARDSRNNFCVVAHKYAPCPWKTRNGYKLVKYKGKDVAQHRIAWFLVYGYWPYQIDHINQIRSDNRLSNLREVNREKQARNHKLQKNNSSGIPCVGWNKRLNRWQVRISDKGKLIHLGYFDDFFQACCARKSAENRYRYHKNHGKKGISYVR